jgi:hypothetical protein
MKNSCCRFAVFVRLLFVCLALIAHSAIAEQPMQKGVQHDPTRAYRALVICVDRSLSPAEEQFHKLLAVMEEIAERDVTYNDLVWLIDIQSSQRPARLFQMPARNSRRSAGASAAHGLRDSKSALISAIRDMSQVSGSTDLKDPLDAALDILRSHPHATERILLMGSDFLTDTGSRQVSLEPPKAARKGSAAGVAALLLVTYPKLQYLRGLRIAPSDLLTNIEAKWTSNLKGRGSSSVTVRLVDSVPISVRAAALRTPGK